MRPILSTLTAFTYTRALRLGVLIALAMPWASDGAAQITFDGDPSLRLFGRTFVHTRIGSPSCPGSDNIDDIAEFTFSQSPAAPIERSYIDTAVGTCSLATTESNRIYRITKETNAFAFTATHTGDLFGESIGPFLESPTRCQQTEALVRDNVFVPFSVGEEGSELRLTYSGELSSTAQGFEGGCTMPRPAGEPNQSQGLFSLKLSVRRFDDGFSTNFALENAACGTLVPAAPIEPCDGNFEFERTITLEPGRYQMELQIEYDANGSATLQYNSEVSFALGPPPECNLTWNDSDSGGLFDDEDNWSPQISPTDDGSGCNNLIFDRAGGYDVAFETGAAANSVRVLSGLPSFSGGSLTLPGTGVTDGLSISNQGGLTLNAGSITAGGVGVGVDPPTPSKGGVVPASLEVKAGATLSSLADLDIARQPGTTGLLLLEGGDVRAEALVAVQGDATLGVFGEALVTSSGTAQLSVSGDLTLGQFPGSEATVDMVGASDPEVLLASLAVGGALTVASEGQAGVRLAGLFGAKLNAARVGALAGSDGFINVEGAPGVFGLFEVAEDLVVGGGGKGAFVIRENAEVSANNVVLGADDGATGTLQAAGKGGKLKARQNVIVGDEGHGLLTLADGALMEAASLTVNSNPGPLTRAQEPSRFNVDGREQPLDIAIAGEIIAGGAGSGEIELLEEAVVRAKDLALGVLPGSSGVVFFLGGVPVDTDLNDYDIVLSDTVSVGVGGEGRLATRDAGFLGSRNMNIGVEPGGFGRFSAAGELNQTEVSEMLTIGDAGRGELSIESAAVFAGACQIAAETGGLGLVQIQFGGELNITDELETGEEEEFIAFGAVQIGGKGAGLVELFDNGTVLSCSVLTVGGESAAANGTLNIASGAIAVTEEGASVGAVIEGGPGIVRVGNGGAMQIGGELLIGPNGLLIAGAGSNVTMAKMLVVGQLAAGVEVIIDRPSKAELVSVKGQPGPAVFDGDMEIAATGSLEVAAGAGDALVVTGATTLDGTLKIILPQGAAFSNNDLLDLIDFQGGVTGSFANVDFVNAPEGFDADIELDGGTLQMRIINGGTATGEGEGEGEGEPPVPGGCNGCQSPGGKLLAPGGPWGSWLIWFFSAAILLGTGMQRRRLDARAR